MPLILSIIHRFCFCAVVALAALGNHGSFSEAAESSYRSMACAARLALTTMPLSIEDFSPLDRQWVYRAASQILPASLSLQYRLSVSSCTLYEAKRAGLDPVLVLAIIQTESNFQKYCISSAGALGLMQIMPFWQREIGLSTHNLFDIRQNLRFGCIIFRHYLELEKGNIGKALSRYNGSYGKKHYPIKVLRCYESFKEKFFAL